MKCPALRGYPHVAEVLQSLRHGLACRRRGGAVGRRDAQKADPRHLPRLLRRGGMRREEDCQSEEDEPFLG